MLNYSQGLRGSDVSFTYDRPYIYDNWALNLSFKQHTEDLTALSSCSPQGNYILILIQ